MKNPTASQAFDEKTKAEELAMARRWMEKNSFSRLLPILREEDLAAVVDAAKALEHEQGLALRANPSRNTAEWDAAQARGRLEAILITLYQSIGYKDADARLVQALRMFTIQRFGTDMLTHFMGLDDEEQSVVDAAARRLLALVSNIVDWEGEFSPEHVQAAREEIAVVAYLFAERNTVEGEYTQLWQLKKTIAQAREHLTIQICEGKSVGFITVKNGTTARGPGSLTQRARHNATLMLNTALEFLQKGDKLEQTASFDALLHSNMMYVQTLLQEQEEGNKIALNAARLRAEIAETKIKESEARIAELQLLLGMDVREEDEDRFSGVGE